MLRRAENLEALDHLAEVEGRREGMDLLVQRVDQPLAGDDRIAGDVVDRLFWIELGALPADLRQDVDEMGLDVEQPEFEHGEHADRAGADDHGVSLNGLVHASTLLGGSRHHEAVERLASP